MVLQRRRKPRLMLALGMGVLLLASPSVGQTRTRLLTAIVLSVSNESLKVLTPNRQAVVFVVSPYTKVIGKGLATLIPSRGRLRLADALRQGDLVRITYREAGDRKVAIQIERLETER